MESTILDNLIMSLDDENPIELPHSYTRDEIPVYHHQIPKASLIKKWTHLSEIAKKIPEFEPDMDIAHLQQLSIHLRTPRSWTLSKQWPICPPSLPWLDSQWTFTNQN